MVQLQARAALPGLPSAKPADARWPGIAHWIGSPPVASLTGGLALITFLLAGSLPDRHTPFFGLGLLILGVMVAELRPVRVERRTQHQNFTLIEGPVVAGLAMSPTSGTVMAIGAGIALAQLWRRIVPFKLAFNIAQYSCAAACATWTATQVHGTPGVVAGIAVFTVVNGLLMRLVMWIATGRRFGYGYREGDFTQILHVAAVASVALIAVNTFNNDASLLPAFVGPLVLLQWSQEQANRRRAQGSIARTLAQQAASLYGRSSHESATLILRSALELLTCATAEIVLLGPEGGVRLRQDLQTGAAQESRVGTEQLTEGWTGSVLESVRATSQDRWAGVVIGTALPVALLAVWRGPDQDVFREIDCELLQQLADDVQTWLTAYAGVSDAVDKARLHAADLGGNYVKVADALGSIVRVRQSLLAPAVPSDAEQHLAEELREAANGMASFITELITIPSQPGADNDDVVHMGRWIAAEQ